MIKQTIVMLALWTAVAAMIVGGCNDGIDDWNGSARISGHVYSDPQHSQGIAGIRVIVESDPEADNPYEGPDRWTETAASGYFEKSVFLGNHGVSASGNTDYVWVADLSVSYFMRDKVFSWNGGITVSPGSNFLLPPIDTTMFLPLGSSQNP
jgi:hypothetical protein